MKSVLKSAFAATALILASPALAGVTIEDASFDQGILVHGTGEEQNLPEVIGNLGANGPNIVHFNGTTDDPATDNLRLQDGEGQADVTGAEISIGGNPEAYDLLTGNIFLENHEGMSWIEFALTRPKGADSGTVDFWITLDSGDIIPFLDQLMGNGDTHFGFAANGGDLITNVFFSADNPPGSIDILKQVRILREDDTTVVPEPSTWAMMLMGFGLAGFAMRRRRRDNELSQLA
jgi:hypothetical protein